MNISVNIITNNNPNVIKAIESVYSLCREIILVNTVDDDSNIIDYVNSHDKIKLYNFKWNDSFADARNYGLQYCTQDYILSLDSDEVLSGSIHHLNDDYDFYFLNIENKFKYKHKYLIQESIYKSIRLFKNHIGIKYENMIHESVEGSVKSLKGAQTDILIIHEGYNITEDELREKAERNFRILSKDKNNVGRNIHLAKHYSALEDYKSAIRYGDKVLKQKEINADNKAIICNMIYDCYDKLKLNELGISYLIKSIKFMPMQITARYMICNYIFNLKDRKNRKETLLNQLITIGSLVTYKTSQLSNDLYCDINFINKKRREIELWQ